MTLVFTPAPPSSPLVGDVTISMEDQVRSVYRLLWVLYADRRFNGLRIEMQRVKQLVRPHMRLEHLSFSSRGYGRGIEQDNSLFAITYYATSRKDAEDVVDIFHNYITNGGADFGSIDLIPAWRFGWNFPQPFVESRAGGILSAGTYEVRVSGFDICGNESAASKAMSIVLDGTNYNAIYVMIPRVPWAHPLFPSYNVFVNGHLEQAVVMPRWGYPNVTFTTLKGTGRPPWEAIDQNGNINAVRWKFLRVENFSSSIREDLIENGVFQATITLETSIMQARALPQTGVIENVQSNIEVM
jgi:hypothetical protein